LRVLKRKLDGFALGFCREVANKRHEVADMFGMFVGCFVNVVN